MLAQSFTALKQLALLKETSSLRGRSHTAILELRAELFTDALFKTLYLTNANFENRLRYSIVQKN